VSRSSANCRPTWLPDTVCLYCFRSIRSIIDEMQLWNQETHKYVPPPYNLHLPIVHITHIHLVPHDGFGPSSSISLSYFFPTENKQFQYINMMHQYHAIPIRHPRKCPSHPLRSSFPYITIRPSMQLAFPWHSSLESQRW